MSLTSEMRSLKQEITHEYKDRAHALEKIGARAQDVREEARGWLGDFNEKRQSMSKHLRSTLAHEAAQRAKQVRSHLSKAEATRSGRVQSLMEKIDKKNSEAAQELREGLNRVTPELSKEVKGMMKDFRGSHKDQSRKLKHDLKEAASGITKAVAHLKKECAHKLEEVKKDIQGARSVWAELGHPGEKGEKKKLFGHAHEVKREREVGNEEKAALSIKELGKEVLSFIQGHPRGVKESTLLEKLGASKSILKTVVEKLLEIGKVKKNHKRYLPADEE